MTKKPPPPPDARRCRARSKRTGERCKNWALPGYRVCRFHGANPKNPGGGPRPGNRNAVKHGLYENVVRERLTPEEQALFDAVPTDVDLTQELRILRFKLLRLMDPVTRDMVVATPEGAERVRVEVDEVTKAYAIEKLVDGIRKLVKDMQGNSADDPLRQFVEAIRQAREARDGE